MAAIMWTEVNGQNFTEEEAREAADFHEVLRNFGLEANMVYQLFSKETLTVPKRLVLAIMITVDDAAMMVLSEEDPRVREVIQFRLREERLNASGGIIS